jgi:hypothetical protein
MKPIVIIVKGYRESIKLLRRMSQDEEKMAEGLAISYGSAP